MKFDIQEINDSAGLVSGAFVDAARERYGLSTNAQSLSEIEVLKSPCGIDMVRGYVLGAIRAYHQQLRQSLLERGLDIGPFDMED